MNKNPYSDRPCACGCGKPAKARGVYHSDACCQRLYRERHAERVTLINRRYYCKRKGLPMPEEPRQEEMFPKADLPKRPTSGRQCACGRYLYSYETGEKCLKCLQAAHKAFWYQPIKHTATASRVSAGDD